MQWILYTHWMDGFGNHNNGWIWSCESNTVGV